MREEKGVNYMNLQNYEQLLKQRATQYKGVEYEFQEIGKDMTDYFSQSHSKLIWSLFYKHKLQDIKYAFKVCQDKGITNIRYLLGILKNI
jgi:hypothetical protein